jgi:hypothetical protein
VKPKLFYLVLCILGAVLPYSQFVPWLAEHVVNGRLFVQQLFATRISTFFARPWSCCDSSVQNHHAFELRMCG